MKVILEALVKEMVDDPSQVLVEEVRTPNNTVVLNVKTAPADTGKIIGKQGKNIQALRTIFAAIATRQHSFVILEVTDGGSRSSAPDCNCNGPKRERSNRRS